MNKKSRAYIAGVVPLVALVALSVLRSDCCASSEYRLSEGHHLKVPVYSDTFGTPQKIPFSLATILGIRNTDISNPVKIIVADYYDTNGKLIVKYCDREILLAPLESTYLYLPEDDKAGGFAVNLIVKWSALKELNAPITECVMPGMKRGQGISFVSPAQAINGTTK
jgi:hypothetical protein